MTIKVTGIDHIYLTVSDMARAQAFYDAMLRDTLGFRTSAFALGGDAHVQYFNRHLGIVIRPARVNAPHQSYAPGLHHLCLRVETVADVVAVAQALQARGLPAGDAQHCPQYAPDYWATYVNDPDGLRLEVTNYRQERRDRHDRWDAQPC
jgi:glyoxylase I family protein